MLKASKAPAAKWRNCSQCSGGRLTWVLRFLRVLPIVHLRSQTSDMQLFSKTWWIFMNFYWNLLKFVGRQPQDSDFRPSAFGWNNLTHGEHSPVANLMIAWLEQELTRGNDCAWAPSLIWGWERDSTCWSTQQTHSTENVEESHWKHSFLDFGLGLMRSERQKLAIPYHILATIAEISKCKQ